jgi:hypothetical protein
VVYQRGVRFLALVAAAALVAASAASAKEGVTATLRTSIPLDAPAGTHLRVAWTLAGRDHRPFNASGVFVRLLSASGARAETGFASAGAHSTGEYAASVAVPTGGIGKVKIGLRGWSTGPAGTHEADVLFPIANEPTAPATRTPWLVILVAAAATAAAALWLVRRRGGPSGARSRRARRGASRAAGGP